MQAGTIAQVRRILAALLLVGVIPLAFAMQELPEEPQAQELPQRGDVTVLETVVVSGVAPGPGLWKVRHGDHTMWILGTLQPVAKRMQWEASGVKRVIASAEIILYPPSMKFDLGLGKLRQLLLLPSMLGARKNPDGDKLIDHVSPEDYARWLVLKEKYMGRDGGVEKRRPMFAADALYREALDASGLQFKGMASPVVGKLAKKHKIPVERPTIQVAIDDPKGAIRDFRESAMDDAECFRKTLDHLETDLEKMRVRANAWATGDMLTLREISYEDQSRACMDAFLESSFAKEQGIDDLPERLNALWLEAAEKILAEHETSFAILPMSRLVTPDGYLAQLAALGYEIEEP